MDIAIVSVIATSTVGLAAVIVPPLSRRGDRRHEWEVHVREKRAEAYAEVLRLMQMAHALDENTQRQIDAASTLTWLWGSDEVRELFVEWANAYPGVFGPNVTAEARRRQSIAATALRMRMSHEVQGRVPV